MDPIGTIRRVDNRDGSYAVLVRMDPGYPDREFPDNEWTVIWSSRGDAGQRNGVEDIERPEHPVIGQVRGTPAQTGSDVEVGDKVLLWATVPAPAPGRIVEIFGSAEPAHTRTFSIELTDPTSVAGKSVVWKGFHRPDFELVEDED